MCKLKLRTLTVENGQMESAVPAKIIKGKNGNLGAVTIARLRFYCTPFTGADGFTGALLALLWGKFANCGFAAFAAEAGRRPCGEDPYLTPVADASPSSKDNNLPI